MLVPGACHGGWCYQPLVTELQRKGHRAHAVTLAGLRADGMDGVGPVTLDSHVAEVAAAVTDVADQDGEAVVLVGHSYGGTVITGAADQVPQHLRALVYLDAFVPDNGDSCWSMTNDAQRPLVCRRRGANRPCGRPPPVPRSAGPTAPASHPGGALDADRHLASGPEQDLRRRDRLAARRLAVHRQQRTNRADPAWTVHRWHTRDNVLHEGPQRLLQLGRVSGPV